MPAQRNRRNQRNCGCSCRCATRRWPPQLSQLPELNGAEQAAIRTSISRRRPKLAFAAFLLPDWQSAEIHLIQERDEAERWSSFGTTSPRQRTDAR